MPNLGGLARRLAGADLGNDPLVIGSGRGQGAVEIGMDLAGAADHGVVAQAEDFGLQSLQTLDGRE